MVKSVHLKPRESNQNSAAKKAVPSWSNLHAIAASFAVFAKGCVAGAVSVLARVARVAFLAFGAAMVGAGLDVDAAECDEFRRG